MLRTALVLVAAGALAGCSAGVSLTPNASSNQPPEQLAAYAGHASYPSTMPASDDLKAAALVSGSSVLKIYNFGRDPINDADVWVNGAFVYHVDDIPPQSSVTIPTAQLYNGSGVSFASQGGTFSRVQIKTATGLYNLWGPAAL
jgi:hypothetical protein